MAARTKKYILHPTSPQLALDVHIDNKLPFVNWQQRSLLIDEILFLTHAWNPETTPNPTCIYVGAAEGWHIRILSELFPRFFFICYDPQEFTLTKVEGRIQIFNGEHGYFDNTKATNYAGRDDIFFISDIFHTDSKKMLGTALVERALVSSSEDIDKNKYHQDKGVIRALYDEAKNEVITKVAEIDMGAMIMQQTWVRIIHPISALLKFRLTGNTNEDVFYLSGDLLWQPWSSANGTETRLMIDYPGYKTEYPDTAYNPSVYKRQCHYHNLIVRPRGFDQRMEKSILAKYIRKFGQDKDNLKQTVSILSQWITDELE